MNELVNVVIKGSGKNTRYLVPSPLGGYAEITQEEFEQGMVNGTLRIYRPNPAMIALMKDQLPDE